MAEVRQKPKMDKPKMKSTASALPKDARRMLMNEYKAAADGRANDARQRPEYDAVNKVENAMRSTGDRTVSAAKRGSKRLGRTITGKKGSAMKKASARKEAIRDGLVKNAKGTSSDIDAIGKLKTKQAYGADKKAGSSLFKSKPSKPGFSLKSRHATANAGKSVKTVKAATRRAKTVKNAAKKVAKASANFAKKAAMLVAKAAAATISALIAAGPVGLVVLLCIVLIGIVAVIASPFGIFFSGEDTASKNTMQQTIASITYDYQQNIQDIIGSNSHDEMRIVYVNHGYSRADNWNDVLAVYAVDTANFGDDGMDVVELDDERIEKLRTVFWEMQDITYEVKNERQYDSGSASYNDHHILYIQAECVSAWTMADTYDFDEDQREVLAEMLSGEYDDYFREMVGASGLFGMVGDGGAVTGTGNFIWPSAASTYVTSRFGGRVHPITGEDDYHGGIDISAGEGTGVLAADGGTVISDSVDSSYGIHMLIDHGNGYQTLYAHMSAANVAVGDSVDQGQIIGQVGSTGTSTNPHLHFEVRVGGSCVDPILLFSHKI